MNSNTNVSKGAEIQKYRKEQ